jgi:hypothetical protein
MQENSNYWIAQKQLKKLESDIITDYEITYQNLNSYIRLQEITK